MANLTIAIDADVLKRARIKAIEQGTSVNAVLREHLERYVGDRDAAAALEGFAALARESEASSGDAGRTWRRDDVYER